MRAIKPLLLKKLGMKKLFSYLLLSCFLSFPAIAQDAASLYQEGVQLKDAKKIPEAVEKFKQAIELKPGYNDALYELGWCRNDMKDYNGAIEVLRKVMPAMSGIYKANFELGYAFEKNLKYDSALAYYDKCISIAPNNAGVYRQLTYVEYQLIHYAKALEHAANFERLAKEPSKDYLYWYRKGFMQNALKDHTAARISLNKSLELKTDYTNTYLELGFASSRLKEDDVAIDYYKKAIETDPKGYIAYNGIGEVYRDYKKDREEAMVWYKKTLAMNPNERKANFGVGYCLNSAGRYNEAIPHLKKAIEMEATYAAAYVELGYSYYKTNNNTDALTSLDKAIAINPKYENAIYYKGLVFISQKDKPNAQAMLNELNTLKSKLAYDLQASVSKM
jgi:tetratricopeptide (TPR) repeat protein